MGDDAVLKSTTSEVLVVFEGHDDDDGGDEDFSWTTNFFYLPRSCQGAVFITAKFEVFPTLSLKTFTHFAFPLRIYQTNSLSLPSFSHILTNQDIDNG